MLRKILVIVVLPLWFGLWTTPFEIESIYLRFPAEIGAEKLLYENSEFKMILSDGKTYTFKLESLDSHLRFIDLNTLRFSLGMSWKFEYDENMVASDSATDKEMANVAHDFKTCNQGDPLFEAAISLRPALGYLEIYEIDNGEYGIHICKKIDNHGIRNKIKAWLNGQRSGVDNGKPLTIGHAIEYPKEEVYEYQSPSSEEEPKWGESRKAYERRMEELKKRKQEKETEKFFKDVCEFVGVTYLLD